VQGYYNRDHAFFHEYHQATRTHAGMAAWLDQWVYGVPDRAAYLAHLGEQRWRELAPKRSLPAAPVDYGY
jgi:glutaconate CoA-transferase subunit A